MLRVHIWLTKLTTKLQRIPREKYALGLFLFVLLVVLLTNTFHEKYPDEFDNILGGWFILHGKLPYIGFFTHHGPVAYFIAAFFLLFSFHSFVLFRIVYALFLFAFLTFTYWYLSKQSATIRKLDPYYLLLLAFSATYFWGHMFLADSISGYFITPVIFLLMSKALEKKALTRGNIVFVSILSFCTLLCSLTYTYLMLIIYGFVLYLFFKDKQNRTKKEIASFLGILVSPYILFFLYLLVTQSLSDYLYQAISFNQKYYIYNYPRPLGNTSINPLRFAFIIAHGFFWDFTNILQGVRNFTMAFPFPTTMALANFGLVIYLFYKRHRALGIFIILSLIYMNARSNVATSGENDYQSAVYIMTSLFMMCFTVKTIIEEVQKPTLSYVWKVFSTIYLFVFCFYLFFTGIFLFGRWMDKAYTKYMGTAPAIYDRPELAPVMNRIVGKDDYTWYGPFAFEELFYMQGKLPSKYHILLPGFGSSEKIQQELVADFSKNKPKVLYFNSQFYILGQDPQMYGQFFISFLNNNYFVLIDHVYKGKKYRTTIPVNDRIDLDTHLYIDKNREDEVMQELLEKKIITER